MLTKRSPFRINHGGVIIVSAERVCASVQLWLHRCDESSILQQGKTPQLDAPHSIWLTLSPRSLFSPLIFSRLNLSNTSPLPSSPQVTTDCSSIRTDSAARLLFTELWHAARGACEEMTTQKKKTIKTTMKHLRKEDLTSLENEMTKMKRKKEECTEICWK